MNGLYKTIVASEARIGGSLFVDSDGSKSQFYCLNDTTWVWKQGSSTVFYRINPASIHKSNDGISWRLAGEKEVKRLSKAAEAYKSLIETKVYDSLLSLR